MKVLLFVSILALAATCNEPEARQSMTQEEMDERLIIVNQQMLASEGARIDKFIEDKDWPMVSSGTGLRYWIYEDVKGDLVTKGQVVDISYELSLLDGTVVHGTEEGEVRSFKVEGSNVETGLHEALQLMSKGDKAKFILPSHLAHGLIGDQKSIPPKSSIIYDVELIEIQ